jgi:perosamine synthetase
MADFIPVNQPLLDGKEKEYINDCLDTGWVSSEGPYVGKFEAGFAGEVNREYGITVSNGSMALEAAVVALGLGEGDEVIVTAFTIISCVSAIVKSGALPVLVDCDPHTWNMDVDAIEEKITPRTRAIMAVHIYGLPVDMEPVLYLADKYNLLIIEDAAEAIGQSYRGRACGSFGDISVFSFYPNKLVTTGEGGMIVTDSKEIAGRCLKLRNLYFEPEARFVHEEMGWNLRMTNIQAALGLAQLERLRQHIDRKIRIGQLYNEYLQDVIGLVLPVQKTDYAENIYWIYGVVINDAASMTARDAMKSLADRNIGTRPFFYPMHQQPVFKKMGLFNGVSCPVSERIARYGFYIPSGLGITDEQIKQVSDEIKNLFL